jgi:hypothetical protein
MRVIAAIDQHIFYQVWLRAADRLQGATTIGAVRLLAAMA